MAFRYFIYLTVHKKIKNAINNYFGFNKQQRNGLLVLCFLSFFLLVIRIIYPEFITPGAITVENLPLIERKLNTASQPSQKQDYYKENSASRLFAFDPNKVTHPQLVELGFQEKTAAILIKFRNKGFAFRNKEDLKKVYGISEKLYLKLEPYILIEKPGQKIQAKQSAPEIKTQKVIELNSADSVGLIELNGIGSSFAKRILKYRQLLGGYFNAGQLKEVYGFTEEMYAKISPQVSVNPSLIIKLNLNVDDFKTINKHPYISYELTKEICDKRRKGIINAENLKEIITDKNTYEKILPYLRFN